MLPLASAVRSFRLFSGSSPAFSATTPTVPSTAKLRMAWYLLSQIRISPFSRRNVPAGFKSKNFVTLRSLSTRNNAPLQKKTSPLRQVGPSEYPGASA